MNNPALYAKANHIARKAVSDFAEEFEDEFGKTSGRCLDVGSGPGDVVMDFILPKLDPKATIVCSDISDAMVEFGREKYKENRRVSFLKLDIESPDLPKDLIEQFDQVTSTYCLHWCQNIRQVFENIFNLLRPGGTTLLIFAANFPAMTAFKELATIPRYQPYMKDVDRYIPVFQDVEEQRKTLKTSVQEVGFQVQHCSLRDINYIYEPDLFAEFILSINPFVERIPAHLRKEYEKDLVNEAARQSIILNNSNNTEHENGVFCRTRSCVVYAKKPRDE